MKYCKSSSSVKILLNNYVHISIVLRKYCLLLGLCIIYFKRYDTYHDTHEVIFDMYQRYILSGFRPNKLDISTNFMEIWEF